MGFGSRGDFPASLVRSDTLFPCKNTLGSLKLAAPCLSCLLARLHIDSLKKYTQGIMGNSLKNMLLISLVVATGLVTALLKMGSSSASTTLVIYCAAGAQRPMARIAQAYEQHYGVGVQLQYGGSGTLLGNLRLTDHADLFLAADRSYIARARRMGWVVEAFPLVNQRPVVLVPKGNPKQLESLADLGRTDLRLSLANPSTAAIGKQTQRILATAGLWEHVRDLVQRQGVFKPSVTDVANDVRLGAVDAAVVWDNVAAHYPNLAALHFPEFDEAEEHITIALLTSSSDPSAARHFIRYLTARDRGLRIFAEMGYDVVDGDLWIED